MIRNITRHDKTGCTDLQSTTQVTHEENKATCTCDDNAKETHNDLLQSLWVTTHGPRHNSWMSEMIQRDRVFLEKRKSE